MKKRQLKKGSAAVALAVSAAILAQSASAASLGNMIAYSYLNEPLSVVVTIDKLEAGDAETLSARVVSAEAYAAAGVKRPAWADKAQVRVKSLGAGRFGVEITTSEPMSDPTSSLLLELKAKSGDATREYALLLDIKGESAKDPLKADPVKSAAISAKEFERQAAAKALAPAGGSQASGAAAGSAQTPAQAKAERDTVLARKGSVLSAIASATARPGVTHEQMMLGYLRQNPGAFQDGNINRLKSGVIMRVPSKEQAQAVDAAKAREQVAQMASDYKAWRSEASGSRLPAASTRQAGAEARGAVQKESAAPAAGPDELRLGKADKGGAGGPSREDLLAKQKELEESQSRERDLQRVAEDLKKLLAIKDAQLAKLGAPKAAEAAAPAPTPSAATETKEASAAATAPAAALEAQVPGSNETVKAEGEPEATPAPTPEATPTPEAAAPKPAPKPAVLIPAEPTPEPSFMDEHGSSALLGGGLLAALLAALGVSRFRRARRERDSGSVTIANEPSTGPSTGEQEPQAPSRDPLQERLEAADTFMSYGQDDKAFAELEAALAIAPQSPDALIRMARLAAKAKDRQAFHLASEALRSGPAYSAHQRELFQLRSQLPKEEPAQDISQGLESFMDSREREEEGKAPSVVDDVFGASSDPSAPLMEPMEPMEQMQPAREEESLESRFLTPMTPVAPEPEAQGHVAPLEFESISFDLDVPEDRAAADRQERLDPVMDIPSLSERSPTPPGFTEMGELEAPVAKEPSSEVKTMLDLADAYLEMGDKEGARELLLEVQRSDNGEWGDRATKLLNSL